MTHEENQQHLFEISLAESFHWRQRRCRGMLVIIDCMIKNELLRRIQHDTTKV